MSCTRSQGWQGSGCHRTAEVNTAHGPGGLPGHRGPCTDHRLQDLPRDSAAPVTSVQLKCSLQTGSSWWFQSDGMGNVFSLWPFVPSPKCLCCKGSRTLQLIFCLQSWPLILPVSLVGGVLCISVFAFCWHTSLWTVLVWSWEISQTHAMAEHLPAAVLHISWSNETHYLFYKPC